MPRNPNKTDYSGGFPAGFETFTSIADPRDGGNTLHHFGEILFIAFAVMLCGVRSYELMEEFGEVREEWLRQWLQLPNGIPSYNTFSRVFQAIAPPPSRPASRSIWGNLASRWSVARLPSTAKPCAAPAAGKHPPPRRQRVGLRCGPDSRPGIRGRENEITAIPELLEMRNLRDAARTTTRPPTLRRTSQSCGGWP